MQRLNKFASGLVKKEQEKIQKTDRFHNFDIRENSHLPDKQPTSGSRTVKTATIYPSLIISQCHKYNMCSLKLKTEIKLQRNALVRMTNNKYGRQCKNDNAMTDDVRAVSAGAS